MKNFNRGQRAKRLGAALFLLWLPVLPLQARGKPEAWASTQYSAAERLRKSLKGLPSAQQSRQEYQRVIAAYRRVYYGSPASSKADPSVVAVAELLTEMGRRFDDDKALHAAIGQYKFLRREYPGSRDRFEASSPSARFIRMISKIRRRPNWLSRSSSAVILATIWPTRPASRSPNQCSRLG